MLTITNKRLVFDGAGSDRTIALGKIVSVDPRRDSVEVSVENRQKSMVFEAANPFILASIIRLSCQGWDALSDSPQTTPAQTNASPPKPEKKRRRPKPQQTEILSNEFIHGRTLGLSGTFTFAEVKQHYRERMMEYHPDRVAALGPKLREVAEAESRKINAAYEFFTKKYETDRNA
jgi:hypothetical protein